MSDRIPSASGAASVLDTLAMGVVFAALMAVMLPLVAVSHYRARRFHRGRSV